LSSVIAEGPLLLPLSMVPTGATGRIAHRGLFAGLMDPAARRLPGQFFERAAALAFPEDRERTMAPSPCLDRVLACHSPHARGSSLPVALYSGPTTIAPTIRICELVRIPTAAIRPAMISSR
jgi:hypothetical protein